jgi:hypothetical protein
MPYSYDTEPAPLPVDSVRMDLDDQEEALKAAAAAAEARRTADQKAAWLGAAAQSPAPRVPRLHRLVGSAPACSADDCMQGRRECSDPGKCLTRRLIDDEDIPSRWDAVLVVAFVVLAVLVCMAIATGMRWSDVMSLLSMIGGSVTEAQCCAT